MVIVVNPIGNFPLNDDWVYAHPVLSLINNGTYGSTGWSVSTLFTQEIWGFLFCLLSGGFSFTALRFSTLTLGLAGILVLYFLVYDVSKNKKLAFLAALLLMANPIYFSCSNTFMTDVPFMSLALFSMYFFFKALDNLGLKFLLLATLFSVAAVLVRQLGMIIPVAFAITTLIKLKQPFVKRLLYFIPFFISVAAYKLYIIWLNHNGNELFWMPSSEFPTILAFFNSSETRLQTAKRFGDILFYYGLLFLPFLLIIKINYSFFLRSVKLKIIIIAILACIAISYVLFYRVTNWDVVLHRDYVFPHTLSNFQYLRDGGKPSIPVSWYILGVGGALLLSSHLIIAIIKLIRNFKTLHALPVTTSKHFFVSLCIIGYVLLILYPWTHYDRYLLPLFAWYCILITIEPQINRSLKVPFFILTPLYISAMILFSAFTTHDYLAWNRARWKAVDYLTKDLNISMHKIDAGYEANGWLTGYGRKWNPIVPWNVIDGQNYILSFEEADGYDIIYSFPYESYMPPFNRNILVSRCSLDETAEELKKSIPLSTQNSEAYDQLGLLYFRMNDYDNAIQAWNNYVTLNPKTGYCYSSLGFCYLYELNYGKAEKYFEKAIELNPDFIPAYMGMMSCYQYNNNEPALRRYVQITLDKGVSLNYILAHKINVPKDLLK